MDGVLKITLWKPRDTTSGNIVRQQSCARSLFLWMSWLRSQWEQNTCVWRQQQPKGKILILRVLKIKGALKYMTVVYLGLVYNSFTAIVRPFFKVSVQGHGCNISCCPLSVFVYFTWFFHLDFSLYYIYVFR